MRVYAVRISKIQGMARVLQQRTALWLAAWGAEQERQDNMKRFNGGGVCRHFACIGCASIVLVVSAQFAYSQSCAQVKRPAPSDADKALLAGDSSKAEGLYRTALGSHPGDVEGTIGLVHALLGEQKVAEAADVVKAALAASPNSAAFITLRGEIEFRSGELWLVEPTVVSSYKLDPCNPRTRLLFARYAAANSRYATARQQILMAHQLDPEDPEIRAEWIETLPLEQRINEQEAYLSEPRGDDPLTLGMKKSALDRWKKEAAAPAGACRLVSKTPDAEIPFVRLMFNMEHMRAFGLEVGLNSATARMEFSTGQSGFTVYRSVAERAGLKKVTAPEPGAFPGAKPTYEAHADSIKLGGLEFQDCTVTVIDSNSPFDDGDGMIGTDVFEDFLVTLDYPMRKLQLGALPARPGDAAGANSALETRGSDDFAALADHWRTDRVASPETKDFTQLYRAGHNVILPTLISGQKIKLMILDTAAGATSISPDAAREAGKVHFISPPQFGPSAGPDKLLVADEVNFNFAHFSQKLNGVVAFDTAMASKATGMEISGTIGANTLYLLTIHIDYRDGMLKLDYDPNRGYKF
jgi:cytochrome c-type biogenesis protein CcmH/NrfG